MKTKRAKFKADLLLPKPYDRAKLLRGNKKLRAERLKFYRALARFWTQQRRETLRVWLWALRGGKFPKNMGRTQRCPK